MLKRIHDYIFFSNFTQHIYCAKRRAMIKFRDEQSKHHKIPIIMSSLVSNFQRYSLHDGSGIRTTIFLKGCTLHCPWCSNPENLNILLLNCLTKYGKIFLFGD